MDNNIRDQDHESLSLTMSRTRWVPELRLDRGESREAMEVKEEDGRWAMTETTLLVSPDLGVVATSHGLWRLGGQFRMGSEGRMVRRAVKLRELLYVPPIHMATGFSDLREGVRVIQYQNLGGHLKSYVRTG